MYARRRQAGTRAWAASLALAVPTGAAALVNGSFVDLEGWSVESHGFVGAPGTATVEEGALVLREGDALLTRVGQGFVVEGLPTERYLTFEYVLEPGFDEVHEGFSDAFEVHLVDALGRPLVAPWRPDASAFLSIQQDGAVHAGPEVVLSNGEPPGAEAVSVDLSGLPAGTQAQLAFVLVGGDAGTTSAVRILSVALTDTPVEGDTDVGGPLDTGHTGDPIAHTGETGHDEDSAGGRDTYAEHTGRSDTSEGPGDPGNIGETGDSADTAAAPETGSPSETGGTGAPGDTASEDSDRQDTADVPPPDSGAADDTGGAAPGCADPDPSDGRVTLCHVPPGNPNNARTLTVGAAAASAHLSHGDTLGPCGCESPQAPSKNHPKPKKGR